MTEREEIDKLYNEFCEQYPFASINKKDVADYYRNMCGKPVSIDMLLDYILANGLEEYIDLKNI